MFRTTSNIILCLQIQLEIVLIYAIKALVLLRNFQNIILRVDFLTGCRTIKCLIFLEIYCFCHIHDVTHEALFTKIAFTFQSSTSLYIIPIILTTNDTLPLHLYNLYGFTIKPYKQNIIPHRIYQYF